MAANSSHLAGFHHCDDSAPGFQAALVFNVARLLILPVSLLVLHLGLQQWWRRRSFALTSHSDVFTYHSVAYDLIYMLGEVFYFCGTYTTSKRLVYAGYHLCSVVVPGQVSFHMLTCGERYLAVVHPVLYWRLRHSRGVRIRNASIAGVWLFCSGWIGLMTLYIPQYPYSLYFSLLASALVVVSFCSLSVLRALLRPGPGRTSQEASGRRDQADRTKRRALLNVTAITAALWTLLLGFLVCLALEQSGLLSYNDGCVLLISANFVTLPSSLVLPLLFLHRVGRCTCCHGNGDETPVHTGIWRFKAQA